METEFSIIVPIYNVERWLPACLDSILAQTYTDFELILVDDGSPDGCPAICDRYAAKDPRVHVIHRQNGGVTSARRAALDRARGAYIAFVDGDDWVKPHWLQTMAGCIGQNSRPDVVVFDYVQDDGRTDQPLLAAAGYYDKSRMEREIYPYMLFDRRRGGYAQLIPGYQCTKLIRRPLLLEHFVRDDAVTTFEDVAMVYECMYNAQSLFVCPQALYCYRIHQQSSLHQYDPALFAKIQRSRDYLAAHLLRQAPEMTAQANCFFAAQTIRAVGLEIRHSASLGQAARRLKADLRGTGLAGQLRLEGVSLRNRLFLLPLKCHAYYLTVLIYSARVRLYQLLHRKPA